MVLSEVANALSQECNDKYALKTYFEVSQERLSQGFFSKRRTSKYYKDMCNILNDFILDIKAKEPQVEERAFFEYHLYEVQRPVTVKDRQTKQIEFATASAVSAVKFFVYDASQRPFYSYAPITEPSYGYTGSRKVMVMLEFENSEEAGLGIPLPKGLVRVYKEDVDGSTQFIGEDRIDHTPRDEKVRLYLGDAFDIVGERTQTNFRKPSRRSMEESFEITIRNHKDEAIEVRVVEHMFRWTEWEITSETHEHVKTDSRTIEYHLDIPANGEETVEYTVFYRW